VHHFEYKNGEMFCEDVRLNEIAERFGTPCYVYSRATLARHFEAFDSPFADVKHLTCFSVKAWLQYRDPPSLLQPGRRFRRGERGRAVPGAPGGGDASKVVYSGVGKTEDEIAYALRSGILMFNVESGSELEAIARVAKQEKKTARVSLR